MRSPVPTQAPSSATALYTCPMHPEVQSDTPSTCPECGMGLEALMLSATALYTCPMHPEVQSDTPSTCPECGMGLEALTLSASAPPNPERLGMQKRLLWGGMLAISLLVLHLGKHWLPAPWLGWVPWLEGASATPVVLGCGALFFARGWQSLRTLKLNMFTLISLGVGMAYGYSTLALLFAPWLPAAFLQPHTQQPLTYFDGAAFIVLLTLLGQVLELRGRERSSQAIRQLLALAPTMALRLSPKGEVVEIPVSQVLVGDLLRILPGAAIPVDGVVHQGQGHVDESLLSGEALPVSKSAGSALIGGALNGSSSFVMQAQKVGADTMLAHMIALTTEAIQSRARIQSSADRLAAWLTPAVVMCALLAFGAWVVWGSLPQALLALVSVLVIACPCAMGLATPMSVVAAVGRGAKAGILVRDAQSLERLAQIDTVLLDKTGTLTQGRPSLSTCILQGSHTQAQLLQLAASVESHSEHPLAFAVVQAAKQQQQPLLPVTQFKALPGQGATAKVQGQRVVLGKQELLESQGIATQALQQKSSQLRQAGAMVMWLAVNQQLAGLLAVQDALKPGAELAVSRLKAKGLRVVMLSGDHPETATQVGHLVGIEEAYGGLLPADKYTKVKEYQTRQAKVLMVGDGVNDAPALAQAHLGMAMDAGSDAAIASAQITLVQGDIHALGRALTLGKAAVRNMHQNLFFACIYNVLGIPLAAGAFYPWLGLQLTPTYAAAAMACSSVCVIFNASRLNRLKL